MQNQLENRHFVLGITGSIAAYKAALLARQLIKLGCTIQPVMTESACSFLGTATLQGLCGRPVLTDNNEGEISTDGMAHIAVTRSADAVLLVPASANTIGQIANGLAGNIVSSTTCAANCLVIIAPAMNQAMWHNAAVARNIEKLQSDGRQIIQPPSGEQACGELGLGRMAEPEQIVKYLADYFANQQIFAGKTIAVSVGATVEAIDDMRIITNRSSGAMGCAVAAAAANAGAKVILLAAKMDVVPPPQVTKIINVSNSEELLKASLDIANQLDLYIGVAAVADFRPKKLTKGKLAKSATKLELNPCQDVIKMVASLPNSPFCVAFAAEATADNQGLTKAKRKMRDKKVGAIVFSPLAKNLGGNSCELVLLTAGHQKNYGKMSKQQAATELMTDLATLVTKQRAIA